MANSKINDKQLGEYLLKLIREQKRIYPVKALVGNKVIPNDSLHESYDFEIKKVQKEIGKRNKKKFSKKEMERYNKDRGKCK